MGGIKEDCRAIRLLGKLSRGSVLVKVKVSLSIPSLPPRLTDAGLHDSGSRIERTFDETGKTDGYRRLFRIGGGKWKRSDGLRDVSCMELERKAFIPIILAFLPSNLDEN